MHKFFTYVVAILSLAAGSVMAQSVSPDVIGSQLANHMVAARPEVPTMTYELAMLIKLSHQAQAQYRRSGSPQDWARVKAMQIELAHRGVGHAPQPMPDRSVTLVAVSD
ncbi:hypothetical protein [Rhodoferax sp.]|uniref:hypothetical protein n=1 Tax=Rhodoferax sp. TaxID=50421 RepID=UPI0026361CBA|nr:hypothetical protein [Rhodoferax sp.]MDD2809429.1 hypothetical protein [Rhodoferax sp.]